MASIVQYGVIKERTKGTGWLRRERIKLEMKRTLQEIEAARQVMERRYAETGKLNDPTIMLVSRQIDGLVNHYQQLSSDVKDKPPPLAGQSGIFIRTVCYTVKYADEPSPSGGGCLFVI